MGKIRRRVVMRFRFLALFLFALLFIFVNSFPVDLLPIAPIWQFTLQICFRALLLGYDIYLLWKFRINIFKFANYKRGLLFLPFVLICFSNIIAAGIAGREFVLLTDQTFLPLISAVNFSLFASISSANILTGLKVTLSAMNLFKLNIY